MARGDHTVTVTVALNFANAITAYSFVGFPAITMWNDSRSTIIIIAVTVPNGTDVTSLAAIFTTTGANVKVGAAVQTSTATANNFVGAVTYGNRGGRHTGDILVSAPARG